VAGTDSLKLLTDKETKAPEFCTGACWTGYKTPEPVFLCPTLPTKHLPWFPWQDCPGPVLTC